MVASRRIRTEREYNRVDRCAAVKAVTSARSAGIL